MSSVTQTPDTLNPANRGGKWILTQTPTSDPIFTKAAWEVEVDGTKTSEDSTDTTSGSDEIVIDPRTDIIGFMKHAIPGLTARSVYNVEDEITCDVTLKFGTIEIDASAEPVVVTKTIGGSSGPFTFINANLDPISGDGLDGSGSFWLSHLPDYVNTHPFAYGWIYLYGTTGINLTWRNKDGTTGSDTMSAPFDVNAIPIGPLNLNLPNAKYYKLEFTSMSRSIEFEVDCHVEEESAGNIIFLEPIGGLTNIALREFSVAGSGSSQQVVLHTEPDSTFATWATYGGRVQINRTGQVTVSGSGRVKYSRQYENLMASLAGSPLAFVQMKDDSGSYVFIKANVQGGSISPPGPDGYSTIQVSATLAHEFEGQKSVY